MGFSRLWLGPAAKPSSEIEIWQVTLPIPISIYGRVLEATEPIDTKAWRRARPLGDPFSVLVYSIIGQQISGYAARAIAGRLQERFGGRMPSPAELLTLKAADFRAIGFSGRKVEYVRSLAEHIISGDLQVDRLGKLS